MASKPSKSKKSDKATGRDSRGRFAKGHPGGPGRPTAARETAYLRTLRESLPLEDLAKIVRKLSQQAAKGDVPSARLLFEHVLPKPTERVKVEQSFADAQSDGDGQWSEFRVAGKSVDQVHLDYIKFLIHKLREREAAEAAQAEARETMNQHLRPREN